MEMDGLPVTLKLHADNSDLMVYKCSACIVDFMPIVILFLLDISDQSSYEQNGVISAPIHMENLACFGTEEKLIDCAHDTDTIEDVHDNDVWVKCRSISDVSKSPLVCQKLRKLYYTKTY